MRPGTLLTFLGGFCWGILQVWVYIFQLYLRLVNTPSFSPQPYNKLQVLKCLWFLFFFFLFSQSAVGTGGRARHEQRWFQGAWQLPIAARRDMYSGAFRHLSRQISASPNAIAQVATFSRSPSNLPYGWWRFVALNTQLLRATVYRDSRERHARNAHTHTHTQALHRDIDRQQTGWLFSSLGATSMTTALCSSPGGDSRAQHPSEKYKNTKIQKPPEMGKKIQKATSEGSAQWNYRRKMDLINNVTRS